MIWQSTESSSEADSQAASESELAVQAAAAASESDSALTPGLGSHGHESRPTRAVTVTGPWLLTTRKSCRQLERRWQPGGPLALALAASSLGMTPHCPGLTLPDNLNFKLNYVTVGRCRPGTMSTQPTECRMKSAVKTKARKTNNQASVLVVRFRPGARPGPTRTARACPRSAWSSASG